MKRETLGRLAAGVAIAVGFGVGVHQWRAAGEATMAGDEIGRRRVAQQAELQSWEARAAAADKQRRELEMASAVVRSTKSPKPNEGVNSDADVSISERLQKDPEYQLLTLKQERAHLLAIYGVLFRKLGLTPEQITRFQDITLKQKEREMDLQAIKEERHLSEDDPAIQKMQGDANEATRAAQRELLGEAGLKSYQDYQRTTWLREMMVGWAGGAAVVIREPFTPAQGEQLVQIMANASDSYRNGSWAKTDQPGYWDAVAAEAKKILTPTQLAYFTTMEPPLPVGARFQMQFYNRVHEAVEAEKKEKSPGKATGSKTDGSSGGQLR